MGIIKAAAGSVGGVMADQWLEIFTCESMGNDVLAMRGVKKVSERSANTKGEKDVISDGSTIIVNSGQSAIAVDRGEVIGVFLQPGEHTYHSRRSASLFSKGGVKGILKQSWERFGYGGVAPVYQFIMYFDMKEHHSNPFSVRRTVNIKDRGNLTQMDISVTMSGMFSFRIVDPEAFYKHVCGNATGRVLVREVLPQLSAELAQGIAVAASTVAPSERGAIYLTDLSEATDRISESVAGMLTEKWTKSRGFAVTSIAISECHIARGDMRMLQELERDRAFTDPAMAAAHLVGAQGDAMQSAAKNPSGGIYGFTAVNAASPTAVSVRRESGAKAWRCVCGSENTTKFCENCGAKRPE